MNTVPVEMVRDYKEEPLGFSVTATPDVPGLQVTKVDPSSAAAGVISVGDLILTIDETSLKGLNCDAALAVLQNIGLRTMLKVFPAEDYAVYAAFVATKESDESGDNHGPGDSRACSDQATIDNESTA